jgi:GcrA cell cycle regulator
VKTLRQMVWDALPATAPGMLRADLLVALLEAGRRSDSTRLTEAFADLREENSLRHDGKRHARYWRGPLEPSPAGRTDAFAWSPRSLQILVDGWESGESTSVIGLKVGASKNVIVGKARRMKLPPRPSPIIHNGEGSSYKPTNVKPSLPPLQSERSRPLPAKALASAPWAVPGMPLLMFGPPVAVASAPKPPRSRVPLAPSLPKPKQTPGLSERYTAERGAGKCLWMLSEGHPWMVCACQASRGPYCEAHYRDSVIRSHAPRAPEEASPLNPHWSLSFRGGA